MIGAALAKENIPPLTVEQSLSGMLALLVVEREERLSDGGEARKTEAILASAGLVATQIGLLTGKKTDAVRKTIQRSRQTARKRKK